MTQSRIEYIDVAKGILVILLIFHHVINLSRGLIPVDNMEWILWSNVLYVPFFMQAFFAITGYCSSYRSSIKTFAIKNAKALLMPFVFFAIVTKIFDICMFGDDILFDSVQGTRFFFLVESFWFLPALFFAKSIIWFFDNYISNNDILQLFLVMLLFVASQLFPSDYNVHDINYFHWHNALVNLPFIWFGYFVRKRDLLNNSKSRIWILLLSIIYVGCILYFAKFNIPIPMNTHICAHSLSVAPLFILLATTGTVCMIQFAQILPPLKPLIRLGKNSIIVYGIHFVILQLSILLLSKMFIPETHLQGLLFYVLVAFNTIGVSYLVCLLFETTPFKYLIGRF